MEVRFANPQLRAAAHRPWCVDSLPAEVTKELEMIVFWIEHAEGEIDLIAFPGSTDEGGIKSFEICGSYCLQYEFENGVITFLDLWCK
jgi:hypothetical protein